MSSETRLKEIQKIKEGPKKLNLKASKPGVRGEAGPPGPWAPWIRTYYMWIVFSTHIVKLMCVNTHVFTHSFVHYLRIV